MLRRNYAEDAMTLCFLFKKIHLANIQTYSIYRVKINMYLSLAASGASKIETKVVTSVRKSGKKFW